LREGLLKGIEQHKARLGEEEKPMTKNELNQFRAILQTRVAELERLTRQRDGITIVRTADQLEEVQAASERALAVCNLDRECNQLRNARAALCRLQDGTFGVCQRCDEDIHPKRLAAVPWTSFCIKCQEAMDRHPEEMPMPTHDTRARAA
jgi:DnaK suppressor protein